MRVRMRTEVSGSRDGVDWPGVGGELDLPDDEAAAMCANGAAEPVAVEAPVETAVVDTDDVELREAAVLTKAAYAGKKKTAPKPKQATADDSRDAAKS